MEPHIDSNYVSYTAGPAAYHSGSTEQPAQHVDVFFNDSAWDTAKIPAFGCRSCVRRFNDSDQLREHVLQIHGIDSRGPPYAYQVGHISVYPPTARGYAVVDGELNGSNTRVCMDTGSMVSLIDTTKAKEAGLTTKYTRLMRINGIGNQSTSKYTTFTIRLGNKEIPVQAYVLELRAGIILGMDTLKPNGIDVLPSRDVVQIEDEEVPMTYWKEQGESQGDTHCIVDVHPAPGGLKTSKTGKKVTKHVHWAVEHEGSIPA